MVETSVNHVIVFEDRNQEDQNGNPFTPKFKKYIRDPKQFQEKRVSEMVRIGSIIIFRMSKLWKAMFFILCDVIFLVRLQGKFDIDHFWEWKGENRSSRDPHAHRKRLCANKMFWNPESPFIGGSLAQLIHLPSRYQNTRGVRGPLVLFTAPTSFVFGGIAVSPLCPP